MHQSNESQTVDRVQGPTHTWHVPPKVHLSPDIQVEEGRTVDAKDTVYIPAAQDVHLKPGCISRGRGYLEHRDPSEF